jgi:hypothetical protein
VTREERIRRREAQHPLPWCKCGLDQVRFTGESRCENCYAASQKRYHGFNQRVRIERTPT